MFTFRAPVIIIAAFVIAALPTPCVAQPSATANALREAEAKAGLGRWADAIEQYQRILETAGDELVPVQPPVTALGQLVGGSVFTVPWPTSHFIPARWIAHEHISRFPPTALKQYRERIDATAAKRFEEATKSNDDGLLQQLLAEWFNSHSGEDAILLLAQREFERAEFDSAERYWRMLLSEGNGLRYPDPRTSTSSVLARLILVKLFRGEFEHARVALKALHENHSDAAGLLAGRDGKYAETLEALLKDPRQVILPAALADGKEWATFAGNGTRNSLVGAGLPLYWPGPHNWKTLMPAEIGPRVRGMEKPVAPDHPRALAFHPVIVHGRAFVADAMHIYAFDLLSGERATVLDLRKSLAIPGIDPRLPVRNDLRYTLTYADGYLYARLGSQSLRPSRDDAADGPNESSSAIVCIGPITDRKDVAIAQPWALRPPKAEKDATVIFEGSPLIHENRLYAVIWKQSGGGVATSVVCYQLRGTDGPPELLWQREAGKPGFNPASEARARHDMLTMAGSTVIYGTNSGSVVALYARTGKPAWEYRYAKNERRPLPVGRDLCPCLFDGSRIFAAPSDSDRLLCLDAFSGRLLWEREGVDIVHLLGVVRGRLIATFAGSVKGIRGIDVISGGESYPEGWVQHDGGGVTNFGRGFVSPELIYWPTKDGLQFLRPDDGSPARQPVPGPLGNLAYADGVFVVANATEILGFVSDGKFEPRSKEAEKKPGSRQLIDNRGALKSYDAWMTLK